MHASLLIAASCLCTFPPAGTLLKYEGELVADHDGSAARKEVGYTALVTESGEKGATLLWTVAEKGQGAWPWVEQVGRLELGVEGKIIAGQPASVLFEHADGVSPVPLVPPVFAGPEALASGAKWRVDRLQFEVSKPEDKAVAEKAWQIDVATAIGHKRTVIVEKQRQVVADLDEIVFMGPGKKHRLMLALIDEKQLDAEALAKAHSAFDALLGLREDLEYKAQGGRVQWSEAQLAKMKERLPEILKTAAGTPAEDLAIRAGGEVKLGSAVAAATEKLRTQFVGKPAPQFNLKPATLSGTPLDTAELKGKPLVLHIWDYRDNPLVEPYGQIGYLDFLYRRHKDAGVQVFGIAVDERLDRPDTASAAIRSVRKLKSFMNVEYPLVLGGQGVLEKFGDPARLGAELPLVVVIDGEGKVTHYHLGLYEVDRDHGLAELDAAVKALK